MSGGLTSRCTLPGLPFHHPAFTILRQTQGLQIHSGSPTLKSLLRLCCSRTKPLNHVMQDKGAFICMRGILHYIAKTSSSFSCTVACPPSMRFAHAGIVAIDCQVTAVFDIAAKLQVRSICRQLLHWLRAIYSGFEILGAACHQFGTAYSAFSKWLQAVRHSSCASHSATQTKTGVGPNKERRCPGPAWRRLR